MCECLYMYWTWAVVNYFCHIRLKHAAMKHCLCLVYISEMKTECCFTNPIDIRFYLYFFFALKIVFFLLVTFRRWCVGSFARLNYVWFKAGLNYVKFVRSVSCFLFFIFHCHNGLMSNIERWATSVQLLIFLLFCFCFIYSSVVISLLTLHSARYFH